jgi:unsaturated rhamnogalacturonyl hydrolase
VLGLTCLWMGVAGASTEPSLDPARVIAEANRVAIAQLPAMLGSRAPDWRWGVMEAGLADFSQVSPSGERFRLAIASLADRAAWTPLTTDGKPFNADDLCIGQAYLDLYAGRPDPAKLAPLKARVDGLLAHLNAGAALTWSWCDTLFMAPPVLARMSAVTGDRAYLDAMDQEFWRTTAALYDPQEHLFFRDARFIPKRCRNGKKVFWSRGNGWVAGGLVRLLQDMPADYPSRPKYLSLYRDLMGRLAPLQSSDGTWHASLLDPDAFPQPETSGTALDIYAMAWGINHGLLDRDAYLPTIVKGWNAVLDDRRPDGLPGHVQSVGDHPGPSPATATQPYATGALLLAAVELRELAAGAPRPAEGPPNTSSRSPGG